MKGKTMSLIGLLCTAAACALLGVGLLHGAQPQATVAETITTSTKTVSGVEYTFEGDVNIADKPTEGKKDYRAMPVTDIGDLNSQYAKGLGTANGIAGPVTPHNVDSKDNAKQNYSLINMVDQAWTGETGGVIFQFKTDGAWVKDGRIEVYLGDLRFFISSTSQADAVAEDITGWDGSYKTVQGFKWFAYGFLNSDRTMKSDYATVAIMRYKCTAIGGDATAAKGYWLKIYFGKTASEYTGGHAVEAYNGYVGWDMSTPDYDNFQIRSRVALDTPSNAMLHVRRGDGVEKNVVQQEATNVDVGDLTTNPALSNEFMMGKEEAATNHDAFDRANDFMSEQNVNGAVGMEFRTAITDKGNLTSNKERIMSLYVANTIIWPHYKDGKLAFWVYTYPPEGGREVLKGWQYKYDFDLDAEYAWRVTSTPVIAKEGTDDGAGSLVKIYLGKINATTHAPENGWDAAPVLEVYNGYTRTVENNSDGLRVFATKRDGADYTLRLSSNKYVGVKTIVGEDETVTKVARGGSYMLADLTAGNTVCVGYSKGASTYSTEDFMENGTMFSDMNESITATALTMTLQADKKASLRFRQRTENGVVLPLEVSLKWTASATDDSNVAYYFGGIKFGYKLTASNGADSGEVEVKNLTDGFTVPYSYNIIQSNIGAENYGVKFTCQAYVEINGVKYYTEASDMDEDGRSVNLVADAAVADLKTQATGIYTNAIKCDGDNVIRYSYLTQKEYDLLKTATTPAPAESV